MGQLVPADKFSFLASPFLCQAMSQAKELSSEALQAFLAHLAFLCKTFSSSDTFLVSE